MNRILAFLFMVVLFFACKKNDNQSLPDPTMEFVNLSNAEVKDGEFQRIDLDDNNTQDFTFGTNIVTDATLNQTKLQFRVISRLDAFLMLTTGTQTGKKLSRGDSVRTVAPAGSTWSSFSLMVMTEKVTPASGASYWQGEWKDASHHYLPVKVTKKDGNVRLGWIEVSMDTTNAKMILHRGAYSLVADKNVKCGD